MFKITWDNKTGGVKLSNKVESNTIGVAPRPVFFEELDLLKLSELGWTYPRCHEPLLWACNKQYFYRGKLVFEAKGANIYDKATVIFQPDAENLTLQPVDIATMLETNKDEMFLLESETIEFIRDTYLQYSAARKSVESVAANQIDFDTLAAKSAKQTKQQMAIVKQDCDSFDIMPLETAKQQGKRTYVTTKIDKFIASFSGGKDSQVVLDLCTRAIPSSAFEVIYSDTGYELPTSLTLYEDVKAHYKKLYPELKFSTARNHETVLNYWDKIGTPSDTHRWCCSVMKTAPLYRMLKIEGTNKQARVLAFEGSRAEESFNRSTYGRIGKGVKHSGVINARPILDWNTTEVFLYLFKQKLHINKAYRLGKPRVGCLICPFSSEWDDMIVNTCFTNELKPFLNRIVEWTKERNIPNLEEYIKGHKWKLRASGKFMNVHSNVIFLQSGTNFTAEATNAQKNIKSWLPIIGEMSFTANDESITTGNLKYNKNIYNFKIEYENSQNYKFTLFDVQDTILIGLLKRLFYKSTFCINCEVCEIECPNGALSVYPRIVVDQSKCIHCFKCLTFHTKGCIVADSISMTQNSSLKITGISGYGTFGLREEWLAEFFADTQYFLVNNSLGSKQVPSVKAWLRDAEIMDTKATITPLGECLSKLYQDMPNVVWEIIWINLSHNSPLIKWFISNVKPNTIYSKNAMVNLYEEQYQEGKTTFEYALQALYNLFAASPIGSDFSQKVELNKLESRRQPYEDLSEYAVAYSLYKYAESHNTKSLRVSDLYQPENESGVYAEFGTDKAHFEKLLRTLNSSSNRILVAELNLGLDHITLRDDLSALDALKILTK